MNFPLEILALFSWVVTYRKVVVDCGSWETVVYVSEKVQNVLKGLEAYLYTDLMATVPFMSFYIGTTIGNLWFDLINLVESLVHER